VAVAALAVAATAGCRSTTSQTAGGSVLQQAAAIQPTAEAPATPTVTPASYFVDPTATDGNCRH
jgi:hypothetical protein